MTWAGGNGFKARIATAFIVALTIFIHDIRPVYSERSEDEQRRFREVALRIHAALNGWDTWRARIKAAKFRETPKSVIEEESRAARYRSRVAVREFTAEEAREVERITNSQRRRLGPIYPTYLKLAVGDSRRIEVLKIRCGQYFAHVSEAHKVFDIPERILYGLIFHESRCVVDAKNPNSSALGLNQILNGTWNWARRRLKQESGIEVTSRTDPRSSLMVGAWYLNHLFRSAQLKQPNRRFRRKVLEDWRTALSYYYAGDGCGPRAGCRPYKHTYSRDIVSLATQLG